ncbi:hypothetical protein GCM10027299_18240 [Larkinella ripae]
MVILRKTSVLTLLFLTAFFLFNCKNTETGSDPTPITPPVSGTVSSKAIDSYLVSFTEIKSLSKAQVAAQTSGQLSVQLQKDGAKYDIKVYKVVYNTTLADGTTTKASGAVIVPTSTTPLSMVSQQHGTIGSETEAPSYFSAKSDAATIGVFFASAGYIIVCPDYIGYGESKTIPHTYEIRNGLATASLDMIRATKEFLKKKSIKWNNKLFLTGYSEGGYATMSLQKKIEEEYPTEFNLVASSCGAGAYNKTAFMKYIINEKTAGNPGYNKIYLWALLTYNDTYKLNRPMNYYLKEPYATQVVQKGRGVEIKVSMSDVFTDNFKRGVNQGTDTQFMNAVKDNDVFDWKPKTPTYLYHGTADDLVYFFNSQNAFDAMRKRGAAGVELKPLKNKGHASAASDYLLGTFAYFTSIK